MLGNLKIENKKNLTTLFHIKIFLFKYNISYRTWLLVISFLVLNYSN